MRTYVREIGSVPPPPCLSFVTQVNRQVAECNCAKRFQVEQISATRYRVSLFPHPPISQPVLHCTLSLLVLPAKPGTHISFQSQGV